MYDIYQSNNLDTARFSLGKNGKKKLFIIGLNPSTANKENSDTTVTKVEKVAVNNGFDGFVMLNLYPLRSTNPNGLPQKVDAALAYENTEKIIALVSKEVNPVFWAAWGGGIKLRPYLSETLLNLLPEISKIGGTWKNFGALGVDGHPRHPSRLSYSWKLFEFNIESYIKKFV